MITDNKSVIYDGVVATLEKLQKMGVKLGLCTNKPEKQARELLKRLGLIDFFISSFIGSDTVGIAKPNSKPLLEAIYRLNKKPEEVYFVGDTNTDSEAAKNANVDFIFCEYGHGNMYKIAKGESAAFKIKDFADLIGIYEDKS